MKKTRKLYMFISSMLHLYFLELLLILYTYLMLAIQSFWSLIICHVDCYSDKINWYLKHQNEIKNQIPYQKVVGIPGMSLISVMASLTKKK